MEIARTELLRSCGTACFGKCTARNPFVCADGIRSLFNIDKYAAGIRLSFSDRSHKKSWRVVVPYYSDLQYGRAVYWDVGGERVEVDITLAVCVSRRLKLQSGQTKMVHVTCEYE